MYTATLEFPFHECQIKFIRYSISQRARIYAYNSMCHNSARSAFFSIQFARRFPTCSLLSRRSAENRGDLRSVKRKQEAGIALREAAAAAGFIKRIKAANREAKGRHRLGFSSFLSSRVRLVHSPLTFYSRGKTVRESALVKSRTIVF